MTGRWRRALILLVGVAALASAPAARADRTRLLEVDLQTGKKKTIDGRGPSTRADLDLDAALDSATGGAAFSTRTLETIETALRNHLRAARPRAMPRLLLFLYPGRISRSGLQELREVLVDVDLVVDPCGRSVCQDSVGKHIELLGRAIRQAVLRTSRYTIRFKTVTIRTSTQLRGSEYEVYRLSAEEVVRSGTSGGGGALVSRLARAREGYTAEMTREVARKVKLRRVPLSGPPVVERSGGVVSVSMRIASDRSRYRTQVLGALIGAAEALASSPLTPPESRYVVVASVRFRAPEQRIYTCEGQPMSLLLGGRLSQAELWNSYVVEKKKGDRQLTFSDEEARGGVADEEDGQEDRTTEILAEHVNRLAPCLQAEATRNRRFRGVTLTFSVSGRGQARDLGFRESGVSAGLRSCLTAALGQIRFQRRGGAPRKVVYPMYIKR